MSLALVHSRARTGVSAPEVRAEVFLAGGLPAMNIVGLPEAAVRESRDRVRAAIQCAQFEFPKRRVTVNLAPADLPKEGGRFDLPIAIGILAASGEIAIDALRDVELLGELSLTGELRRIDGALPAALSASRAGRTIIVPHESSAEAALAGDAQVFSARTLLEVVAHLNGVKPLPQALPILDTEQSSANYPDLSEVRGQAQARRALEIAAAGAHHLLLIGPPGCGKTLLASRLPGIMPPLAESDALDVAAIASVSGRQLAASHWGLRPFRAPHHTASAVALIGGGAEPRPGEVSLAHEGVLFLDELAEWDRRALEVMREPMESGTVTISRAARQAEFPARFQLVAAMNPCPCGYAGDSSGRCRCGLDAVQRYRSRLSGPLLDRIDLQLMVPRLAAHELRSNHAPSESSQTVRERVCAARQVQIQRQGKPNARLGQSELDRYCRLSDNDLIVLERAITKLDLSARASHRILRVARTIADLAGSAQINTAHLSEAIGFRQPGIR